jgi:hypothetical protein
MAQPSATACRIEIDDLRIALFRFVLASMARKVRGAYGISGGVSHWAAHRRAGGSDQRSDPAASHPVSWRSG